MGLFATFRQWLRDRFGGAAAAPAPAAPLRAAGPVDGPRKQAVSPNEVFTPTRPRAGRRTLVGRDVELARILDGILDDQAHVVLYSERGRGKTSLSNLAIERLRRRGAIVARCACEAETTFDTMIRTLVRDLPRSILAQGEAGPDDEGCEAILPPRTIRPADVAAIPEALTADLTVFVVDEFDRVSDVETRTRLADTIKLLSDRGLRLTFMVVGVSDTLEQIIGQHPSIQRNIVGVHLPLLRDDEIADMLTKGGRQAGIAFTPESTRVVQGVARGMPYMAQLLGLRIAQSALRHADEDETPVRDADVLGAVERLLDEATSTVTNTYAALAAEPRLTQVLTRLAAAEQDQWGRMPVHRMADQVVIGGCRLTQAQFARLIDAGVLAQPDGPAGPAQFRDRVLIYHVLLLAARRAMVGRASEAALAEPEPYAVGSSA